MVNKDKAGEDKVNNRYNYKKKNLPIISALQRLFRAKYLILEAKQAFNFLQDAFI